VNVEPTSEAAGGPSTVTQPVSPTPRRYQVVLENRADRARVYTIVITAEGYRPAWVEARRLARLGLIETDGERLEPGAWTVREVVALNKAVKKVEPVSAIALVRAARERGVDVSPELYALLVELQPQATEALTPVESDADSEGDEGDEEGLSEAA
jgi:hypothetical protein